MIDELPEGWAHATFGEICSKPQYGWTTSANKSGRGLKLLRTTDISSGVVDWSSVPACDEEPGEPEKYRLVPGDIVVSRAGSVGISHVLRECPPAVFASYLIRFRPVDGISSEFIRLFLQSPSYWAAIREESAGIAIPNINASKLAGLDIPVPPLAEQGRIVARVDSLLAEASAAREWLARCHSTLKHFRQSVLAAACSGRLTADWRDEQLAAEDARYLLDRVRPKRAVKFQDSSVREDLHLPDVPESWVWTNLRFLLSPAEPYCYGVVQPGEDDPDGVLLVRAGDLNDGRVDTTGLRRITKGVHHEYHRSELKGGEILVTVVGAGIGETAIAQPECAGFNIARAVAKLAVREFDARYVHLWLMTDRAVSWMKGDSREVARPTLNLEQLETLPVPIPPSREQGEIARRVEVCFALSDEIETQLANVRERLKKLTSSLLGKALCGELVPTEAELAREEGRDYEPASILLERIRERGGQRGREPAEPATIPTRPLPGRSRGSVLRRRARPLARRRIRN